MTSQALFKHDMPLTSLDAFYQLAPHHLTVLRVFAKKNERGELPTLSNHQVSELLGWEINRVTGRTLECREMGFIEIYSTAVNQKTGRSENIQRITKSGLMRLEDGRDG